MKPDLHGERHEINLLQVHGQGAAAGDAGGGGGGRGAGDGADDPSSAEGAAPNGMLLEMMAAAHPLVRRPGRRQAEGGTVARRHIAVDTESGSDGMSARDHEGAFMFEASMAPTRRRTHTAPIVAPSASSSCGAPLVGAVGSPLPDEQPPRSRAPLPSGVCQEPPPPPPQPAAPQADDEVADDIRGTVAAAKAKAMAFPRSRRGWMCTRPMPAIECFRQKVWVGVSYDLWSIRQ